MIIVLKRLTKKRPLCNSSFIIFPFFFQILDMLELDKKCGTIKVSFVLFQSIDIDIFRSVPQTGFLNR